MTLRSVNWLGDELLTQIPLSGKEIFARIRSSQPPQPATLYVEGADARIALRDGEQGIAAGQACVFYSDGSPEARILGGGWISRVLSHTELPPDKRGDHTGAGNADDMPDYQHEDRQPDALTDD